MVSLASRPSGTLRRTLCVRGVVGFTDPPGLGPGPLRAYPPGSFCGWHVLGVRPVLPALTLDTVAPSGVVREKKTSGSARSLSLSWRSCSGSARSLSRTRVAQFSRSRFRVRPVIVTHLCMHGLPASRTEPSRPPRWTSSGPWPCTRELGYTARLAAPPGPPYLEVRGTRQLGLTFLMWTMPGV